MKKDDLIGAKEKEADIYFSDGLKNEQSCEAGRKSAIAQVRECRGQIKSKLWYNVRRQWVVLDAKLPNVNTAI